MSRLPGTSRPVNFTRREVQAAITEAHHRRQGIISLIQMFFAINFVLVYKASANSPWRELILGPGGISFGLYALFSLWCLVRSAQRPLPLIYVAISITLDYALYFAILLLHTTSTRLSALEVSSTPLFSYVYLFIAMRSLHYRPKYVYFAGAMASLSWLFLVLTAGSLGVDKATTALRGLNFQSVILSGSLDKLLAIVAMTFVLGLCVKEANKHLKASVVRGVAGQGLTRMVGADVVKEVLFSRQALTPGRGRKQHVAILMMDIRGFSRLAAESDPSDVIKLLAKYQQLVEPVIVKYGGVIDKYMGDGILAHFGALDPTVTNAAAQTLRCVEHLLHETDRWNAVRQASGYVQLRFRVSCAVGDAVVGLVGGATKMEFTIIGDPVNVTAKLEKHAKRLEARALTTLETYRLAQKQGFRPHYGTREAPGERVAGIDKPLDLIVLGDKAEAKKSVPERRVG